jgi:putative Mn2+ efflux pump MntP
MLINYQRYIDDILLVLGGYMITRQRREQLKEIAKIREENKTLKKVNFKGKKKLPLAVKIGLMKMGFDIEDN